MAKFYTFFAIAAVALAVVTAEPGRFRQGQRLGALRLRSQRQEVATSPAPYPAAGVTPQIPFELPTETEQPFLEPDQTYGPPETTPDQIYGPPETSPDQTYGPPDASPDQTYGPPDEETEPAITELDSTYGPPADETQPANAELVSQSLIQPRRMSARTGARVARLRLRPAPAPLRASFVEIIRSEPVLVYTLH